MNHENPYPKIYTLLSILNGLNTFQYDRTIPMLLKELQVLPGVAQTREDHGSPLRSRRVQVILNFSPVFLFKMSSEGWIRETDCHTNAIRFKKRVVPVILLVEYPIH